MAGQDSYFIDEEAPSIGVDMGAFLDGGGGGDSAYLAGYNAGFLAGIAANEDPPTGPDPIPVDITYEDEEPVDHFAQAFDRLLQQFRD